MTQGSSQTIANAKALGEALLEGMNVLTGGTSGVYYPLGGGLDTVGRTEEIIGAWMRNGFHEDGFASAVDVVEAMRARRSGSCNAFS